MTDFMRGLLVMYAVSGGVAALIYLVMLRHAPKTNIADVFKVLFIAVTGPVSGWLMLWGSINDQIQRSRNRKFVKEQLGGLLADIEAAVEEQRQKAQQRTAPQPTPRFDRHMWN